MGAEEAELCPANTYRRSPGGASRHDCLPCPPQHWCKPGMSWSWWLDLFFSIYVLKIALMVKTTFIFSLNEQVGYQISVLQSLCLMCKLSIYSKCHTRTGLQRKPNAFRGVAVRPHAGLPDQKCHHGFFPSKHLKPWKKWDFICLQESQTSICVLLVITVMVCPGVTSVGNLDPDHVLCTPTVPSLEEAARLTASPALLVHTVTAQVWNQASHTDMHTITHLL